MTDAEAPDDSQPDPDRPETETLGHHNPLTQVQASVGNALLKAWYEQLTQQRLMWAVTPQQEQQVILDRMRDQVDAIVALAVRRIASEGFLSCAIKVEQLTVKDDGAKAQFSLARGTEELHQVMDRVGASAVLVFISPEQFYATHDAVKAQLDQGELPLEE